MATPLLLISLALVLLIGYGLEAIARTLKIPSSLLLIAGGLLLSNISLLVFPSSLLSSMAILTLAFVVFDKSSRIKLRLKDKTLKKAIPMMILFAVLCIIVAGFIGTTAFGIPFKTALLLAFVLFGGVLDPAHFHHYKQKIREILHSESALTTLTGIILFFIILNLLPTITSGPIYNTLITLFLRIITGIGTGFFVGILLFKLLRSAHFGEAISILVAIIVAYGLSEQIGGEGMISVAVLGLFYGNLVKSQPLELLPLHGHFTRFITIFIFMFLGIALKFPTNPTFLLILGIMFVLTAASRVLSLTFFIPIRQALMFTYRSWHELITAAITLYLALTPLPIVGLELIVLTGFSFVIYSVLTSLVVTRVNQ
jgi:NhaP-type Na+/H+ or K+/H+ antiporter